MDDKNDILARQFTSETCSLPPAVIFLKKHKVASTTFRKMIKNYFHYAGLTAEPQLLGPQGNKLLIINYYY
jgi:hypothetical protein